MQSFVSDIVWRTPGHACGRLVRHMIIDPDTAIERSYRNSVTLPQSYSRPAGRRPSIRDIPLQDAEH